MMKIDLKMIPSGSRLDEVKLHRQADAASKAVLKHKLAAKRAEKDELKATAALERKISRLQKQAERVAAPFVKRVERARKAIGGAEERAQKASALAELASVKIPPITDSDAGKWGYAVQKLVPELHNLHVINRQPSVPGTYCVVVWGFSDSWRGERLYFAWYAGKLTGLLHVRAGGHRADETVAHGVVDGYSFQFEKTRSLYVVSDAKPLHTFIRQLQLRYPYAKGDPRYAKLQWPPKGAKGYLKEKRGKKKE